MSARHRFLTTKVTWSNQCLGGSRTCCEIGSQEWNLLVRHLFCSLLTPDLLASKRCGFEALIMSVRTGVTGVLSDGCKACIVGPARTWIIHENPCAGLVNTCYPLLPAYIGRWTWFFWWTGQGLHFWATFANHQTKRWPFQNCVMSFFLVAQTPFKDLRWTFFNALTLGQQRWKSKNQKNLITKGRPPKFETLTCLFLVLIFHGFFMRNQRLFLPWLSMTCCLLWICYDQACQKARTPVNWWVVCRSPFSCWKICGVQQSPTCPTCVAGRINWGCTSMCLDITQRLGWCFDGR